MISKLLILLAILLQSSSHVIVFAVDFFRAVDTLKTCAMTDKIAIIISRDSKSQSDFRRLSNSLLLQPGIHTC